MNEQTKIEQAEMKPSFGQFLAECRTKKELTQKQLADMLFIGESAISKWEQDKRRPDLEFVSKLSEIFGITESELIKASVDKARIKEKKQARWFNATISALNLTLLISFGVAILTCFIVNLATAGTLNWFYVVLAGVVCMASVVYTPFILKKHLPERMKKNNIYISIVVSVVFLFLLLLTVDLVFGSSGWSYTKGLPILLFWTAFVYVAILFFKFFKKNWCLKISVLTFIALVFSNIFDMLLLLLKIENNDIFWQANLTNWSESFVNANVSLLVNIVVLIVVTVFAIVGFRRNNKTH